MTTTAIPTTQPKTRQLSYWVAIPWASDKRYNLRAETKKQLMGTLSSLGLVINDNDHCWYVKNYRELAKANPNEEVQPEFGAIHEVQVPYASAFDLLDRCLGERGVDEGEK